MSQKSHSNFAHYKIYKILVEYISSSVYLREVYQLSYIYGYGAVSHHLANFSIDDGKNICNSIIIKIKSKYESGIVYG